MKILKRILIGIAVIIAIPLITALFVRNNYSVSSSIIINKSKVEVFDYIKSLKNQENYNVWIKMDPELKKEYMGTDGTIGAKCSWNGESGKGEQEIVSITEGEKVDLVLRFIEPMEGLANASLAAEATSDNETKVTWSFSSSISYPFNFLLLCNMEGMMKENLDQGLTSLKEVLEKQ